MKTKTLSVLLLTGLAAAAHAGPPGTGWTLTFRDEFDGTALDRSKWITTWSPGNRFVGWSQEYMLDDHVTVSGGACHLRMDDSVAPEVAGAPIQSGVICSYDAKNASGPRFQQKYGYFEGRLRVNSHPGTLNAFWMASAAQWPPELDIEEILGKSPSVAHLTQHWYDPSLQDNNASDMSDWSGPDYSADWHTFGAYWSPSTVIWYVDGIEKKRMPNHNDLPQFLMANIHAGNAWAGYPDSSDHGSYFMDIDYIRAWSKSDYRQTPGEEYLLDRSAWTATASLNAAAASRAIDGDSATAYDPGAPQNALNFYGNWFQIDLGAAKTFNKIVLSDGGQTGSCPSWLGVYVSQDGQAWGDPVWQGGGQDLQYLYLPSVTARYVRLVDYTADRSTAWRLADVRLYNDTGASSVQSPAPRVNLLSNGGFENGANGWSLWGASVVSSDARSGAAAVKITGSGYGCYRTVTGLSPNTTYVLSGFLRSDGAGGDDAYVWVQNLDGSYTQSAPITGTAYIAASVTFTTGANQTSASLGVWKDAGNGSAWADDLTLTAP